MYSYPCLARVGVKLKETSNPTAQTNQQTRRKKTTISKIWIPQKHPRQMLRLSIRGIIDFLSPKILLQCAMVQKIEDCAFGNCTSLESIKLPSTVTEIGISAFDGCSNLREIEFNDGMQKIGLEAFSNCTYHQKALHYHLLQLRLVVMHFVFCSNVKEVTLNDGLQKIGFWAFNDCSSLESYHVAIYFS